MLAYSDYIRLYVGVSVICITSIQVRFNKMGSMCLHRIKNKTLYQNLQSEICIFLRVHEDQHEEPPENIMH